MKQFTREAFNALCKAYCAGYAVESVTEQFSVTPTAQQILKDKIVEQSEFLPLINIITVDDLEGEVILGSVNSPVASRTDTTADGVERSPRDVLGLESFKYKLEKTNSDVSMRYATLDAWSKFKDFHERYARNVQKRIANDREIVGWYGESAAANTDMVANPLLQDVNKGWMQYMRENKPANILAEGGTAGEFRIGTVAGSDHANLDLAINDLLQGIPKYLRKNLKVLVGDELIARERAALLASVANTPTEKNAMNTAMATLGGLPWMTPSNFPGRGIVITALNNLSIYEQEGSWRRQIKDKPEKDRIEDFNSRNEGYVVENPDAFVALEFKNVKVPNATGDGWE